MASQAQTQAQNNQTQKIIRLKYLYYVKSDKRIAVVLQRNDESSMVAFLDPARVRKVLIVAQPKGEARRGVVVEGDFIYETPLFELKEGVVYPNHVLSYYIIYETDHDYYDPATVNTINGIILKEGGLELLRDVSSYVRTCGSGKLWRVYLREIGKWDKYCFSLDTVFHIWKTNIHPFYGVMD